MLPAGHYQQISQPRTLGVREKWILGSVLGLVAVIAVAVVVAFTSVQKQSHNGCIDVSAATVIGGSELYRCGAGARALCTAPSGAGTSNLAFRRALADACRKAGLPVPAAPSAA
jgi:uncharacterized membrane protein